VAAALARAGVEVARGDLLDCTSLESVFKRAYGVIGVTQALVTRLQNM
jgi:hypothetical protein